MSDAEQLGIVFPSLIPHKLRDAVLFTKDLIHD